MSDRAAVACTNCGHMYALPREFLGKKANCKACGQKFIAAEKVTPAAAALATAASAVAAAKPTGATSAPPPSPAPAIVLPSKREVPIPQPARVEKLKTPVAAAAGTRGNTLDDSVLDWLNDASDDEIPPPPRVVTASDLCEPSQRVPQRGPHGNGA